MNFIKRLQIENFQSHQKTVCVPAPCGQLTVITGPSDTGKTVILRALRWLLFNEPQGSDFIRVGASFARVTAEMESGHKVIRERTKATNRYKIIGIVAPGAGGGQGIPGAQVIEGFGGSVPLEVQEITGVRPVQIGDLNINLNLADQLAGPFLGSSISAPARAKVLGKLAGTEEIDFAAKQLGTDLYRRNQDEKRLAIEVRGLETQIKVFDWLPGMQKKIVVLEKLAAEIKGTLETQSRLSRLKEQLFQVDEKVTATQAVLYQWRNLEQAEKTLADAVENKHSKEALVKLADSYRSYQESILTCEKIIAQHTGLPKAEERLQTAQERTARAKLLHNLRAGFFAWQEIVRHNQGVLKKLEMLNAAEEALATLTARIQRLEKTEELKIKWTVKSNLVAAEGEKLQHWSRVDMAGNTLPQLYTNHELKKNFVALRGSLQQLDKDVELSRGQTVMWENRVAELEGAYHDLLGDVGICPLCGAILSEMRIREVV